MEVKFYDQICFGIDQVIIGFDDEVLNEIVCLLDDVILFQFVELFFIFIGESSQGIWMLCVKVLEIGFGVLGQVGDWSIEFCVEGNVVVLSLLENDMFFVLLL